MTTAADEPKVTCPNGKWRGEWTNGYTVIMQEVDHTRTGIYRAVLEVEYQGKPVYAQTVDLLNGRDREQFQMGMAARNGVSPVAWDMLLTDFYRELRKAQATMPTANPWACAATAQDFCQQEDTDDLSATVKDFVVPGCITIVSAPRGSGKSFVALFIGVALAQGGLFRMEYLAQHRVLLVDRDNSQALVRKRLRALGAEHLTTFKVLTRETAPPLTNKDAWAKFPAEDFDVIIVDSIGAFTEGVSEKEGKQTQEFLATLKDLTTHGLSILALANTTKAGTNVRGRGEQ
jgi:archaellum biogenesis ATPase FlaH